MISFIQFINSMENFSFIKIQKFFCLLWWKDSGTLTKWYFGIFSKFQDECTEKEDTWYRNDCRKLWHFGSCRKGFQLYLLMKILSSSWSRHRSLPGPNMVLALGALSKQVLDWYGLVMFGWGWLGLVWVGWGWFGLVWVGLGWFRLVWVGMD